MRSYDSAPPTPTHSPSFSSATCFSFSVFLCVADRTYWREKGWARSQIIRQRESLALYSSLHTLWLHISVFIKCRRFSDLFLQAGLWEIRERAGSRGHGRGSGLLRLSTQEDHQQNLLWVHSTGVLANLKGQWYKFFGLWLVFKNNSALRHESENFEIFQNTQVLLMLLSY